MLSASALLSVVFCSAVLLAAPNDAWAAKKNPRKKSVVTGSQAVGYYSDGKLEGGIALAQESEGHMRIYPRQEVRYGVQEMIDLIINSSLTFNQQFPEGERLQVGDLSKKGGGKLSNHASHQNGLDADIIYFRVDRREEELNSESDFVESFVIDGSISKNLDMERNWEYFKLLIASGRVNRIFVDQIIKDEMCRYAEQIGELESGTEVLRRLRHWANHADHFHLRLECPVNSTACKPQELPPEGHGCEV
jgi:penicillin-insensitive murein endopeptidase